MSKLDTHLIEPVERQADCATMVLLIDDQTTVAKALQHLLLEATDIDLHYVHDPMDAIRTANAIRPTVILQDLVMPSIEGIDLLKLLRTNPATADTPIIVLSSEENPRVKSRAFSAGANDYLVKLPDKVELIARIRYHSKAYLNQILREEAFKSLQESQHKLSESNTALISLNRSLEEAREKLNIALRESERRTREAVKLRELVDVLQSCQTTEEAYKIVETALQVMLPSSSGALCITSASRNIVEAVAIWGSKPTTEKTFCPDDCWALRRGKIHANCEAASPLQCKHVSSPPAGGSICVPLAAQGETLGVLFVESQLQDSSVELPEEEMEALARQTSAAGERISLALANLRLRQELRIQSIRDPLTGLFNRRYMEESFERELRRGIRNDQPVAFLMLDIDHFKQFNDTFGHQAADTVLRAFGGFLSQRTRGQDIACRYGGEEFALILTGSSSDAAGRRANILREDLKQLVVQHAGQTLGQVTVSIGISAFPTHGASAEELVQVADQALYRAKKEGRDRVVVGS